jgi:hypothetical protein
MKKIFLTACILLLLRGVLLSQSTQNVVIVVIDGARYTETFGDPAHQYIPNIWNQLKPLGTIYTSFYNDGITQTNSGHASILTGTWQSILNDGSELPHKPTIFEYHRKERNSPAAENYVVLGKTKLDILSHSDHPDYGASYGATVDTTNFQYDDVYTLENVKDVIATYHPRLMITNLAGTDRAGHDGPWLNYITKLQRADSIVNALWNLIQTDQSYKDKTTLIVTNDHGRHTTDFRSHGDGCDGCRHITMLIIGPDTPIDKIDSTRQTQIDIAPSLAQLLKFHTLLATGTIIPSAFIIPGMEAYRMEQGWNLISIPRQTSTKDKALLFPTAISPAFIYNGSYVEKETLETGVGYWMKFGPEHDLFITGYDLHADTINIEEGWNLVGTLGVPVSLNNISVSTPDITLSDFFGFNGNYYTADTLLPCRGYWVKANRSGQLFLDASTPLNRELNK